MRVQIVDPAAYTPPYDHALRAALARAGADVELVTSRFPYGPVPRRERLRGERALLSARLAGRREPAARAARLRRCRAPCPACSATAATPRTPTSSTTSGCRSRGWTSGCSRPSHPRVFTMHWRLPDAGTAGSRATLTRAARADGRRRRPLRPRGEQARRRLRRGPRTARGDPARRLRLPDRAGGRGAAAARSCARSRAR